MTDMTEISERQQYVLDKIVREYIRTAEPVSSQQLEKKYALGVKSATVRRDFAELTEQGYVAQPYTSAGRIPTDDGYRFFVNSLLGATPSQQTAKKIAQEVMTLEGRIEDPLYFFHETTRLIARSCRSLAVSYIVDEEPVSITAGWDRLAHEPEFDNPSVARDFLRMREKLDEHINRLMEESAEAPVEVFIGNESKIPGCRQFTLVMTSGTYGAFRSALMLAGPKRMQYPKHIGIIRQLSPLFNNTAVSYE